MYRKLRMSVVGLLLLLSSPALLAAHPDEHHHSVEDRHHLHDQPLTDWTAYPADIQVYKNQLDHLGEQQKGLFEQFKQQRQEIRDLHHNMKEEKRKTLNREVKDLILDLKTKRSMIHTLRDEKLAAWELFQKHSTAKQWDAAKIDMQTVVARKQQIIASQRAILQTQQRMIEQMKK